MKIISALYVIAGIHSTANSKKLKNEQIIIFYDP